MPVDSATPAGASSGIARPSQWRPRLWAALKWVMFAAVIGFVGRHAWRLWHQVEAGSVPIRWGWLAVASAASVVAWVPSCWYWRYLLKDHTGPLPVLPLARAYYCGHLGKYIPGKAAVIVIRTALLKPLAVHPAAGASTAALESMTYMSAGAVLALFLMPLQEGLAGQLAAALEGTWWHGTIRFAYSPPPWFWLVPVAGAVACVLGLALLADRFARFAGRYVNTASNLPAAPRGQVARVAAGFVPFLAAWWLQGLALGLTLSAVGVGTFDMAHWPAWTFDASISMFGGFVAAFAPGGLGVREGLLMLLLEQAAPKQAVLAAGLWRGATLAGEAVVSSVLYYTARGHGKGQAV
jgi:hypothetical protein